MLRATTANLAELLELLTEYFEELQVVKRDTPAQVRRMLQGDRFGFWVAYRGDRPCGCVALRPLEDHPDAAECKRMYVRPEARGHGVAAAMLDQLETFAEQQELRWIYLDSFGDLKAAIGLYTKRGYAPCERYNTNPQATIFLRKRLSSR